MQIHANAKVSPIDNIVELAQEIIDECPSCTSKASEIAVWAKEVRERRPTEEELAALIDATCNNSLPDVQRAALIEGLTALVRFAE
jgi:hypothetical protein